MRRHSRAQGFGPFIATMRCERALSRVTLAKRTGLHPTSIALIERDGHDPRLETIVALARALDMTPAALLDDYARQAGVLSPWGTT